MSLRLVDKRTCIYDLQGISETSSSEKCRNKKLKMIGHIFVKTLVIIWQNIFIKTNFNTAKIYEVNVDLFPVNIVNILHS